MWGGGSGGVPTGNPWASSPTQPPAQQDQNQWSFNPTHYANIPHNQVDWASLAQQWMVLKGAGGIGGGAGIGSNNGSFALANSSQGPTIGGQPQEVGRPLFPNVHKTFPHAPTTHPRIQQQHGQLLPSTTSSPFHHLGRSNSGMPTMDAHPGDSASTSMDIIEEAPMELDHSVEQEPLPYRQASDSWKADPGPNAWFTPEVNNPWASTGNQNNATVPVPNKVPLLYSANTNAAPVATLNRQTYPKTQGYRISSTHGDSPKTPTSASASVGAYEIGYSTSSGGGYWSSSDPSVGVAATVDYSQFTSVSGAAEYSSDENSMPDFDAAKRKALPIWIREGLEKMEREKKRKEDDARLAIQREEIRKKRIEEESSRQTEVEAEAIPQGTRWIKDNSESRPASDDDDDDEPEPAKPLLEPPLASLLKRLAPEEKEEAIMYAIRRVSTSLLVRLTNELLYDAASVSYNRAKSRKKVTPTLQIKKTSALISLTGPLGLGDYASDSEDSSGSPAGSDVGEDEDNDKGGHDSEEELVLEIERKKRNWNIQKESDALSAISRATRPRSRSKSVGDSNEPTSLAVVQNTPQSTTPQLATVANPISAGTTDVSSTTTDFSRSNGGSGKINNAHEPTSSTTQERRNSDHKPKKRSRTRSRSREGRHEKARKSPEKEKVKKHSSKSKRSRRSSSTNHSRSTSREKRRSNSSERRRSRHSRSTSTDKRRDRRRKRSTSKEKRRRSSSSSKESRRRRSRSRSHDRSRRSFSGSTTTSQSIQSDRRSRRDRSKSRSTSRNKTGKRDVESHRKSKRSRSRSKDRQRKRAHSPSDSHRTRSKERKTGASKDKHKRSRSRSTDREKRKSKSRSPTTRSSKRSRSRSKSPQHDRSRNKSPNEDKSSHSKSKKHKSKSHEKSKKSKRRSSNSSDREVEAKAKTSKT